ncbi:hypothetical protein HanIR_Chr02g0099181 [Helianthus annuus]|nr:hypothetical protein HanIR_Chr02g0099181 [Helianthus annuus]
MKKILVSWMVDGEQEPDDPTRVVGGSGDEIGNGWWRLVGGFVGGGEEELVVVVLGGGGAVGEEVGVGEGRRRWRCGE